MIVVTLPRSTPQYKTDTFIRRINHLIKYHPDYEGQRIVTQKQHISLVTIEGCTNRSLMRHISENIRDLGVI
jgi:hypothetical protein